MLEDSHGRDTLRPVSAGREEFKSVVQPDELVSSQTFCALRRSRREKSDKQKQVVVNTVFLRAKSKNKKFLISWCPIQKRDKKEAGKGEQTRNAEMLLQRR